MGIQAKDWGKNPSGKAVQLFVLDDGEGVTAAISSYGGIISSLVTPDRDGKREEIGLGFATLEGYLRKPNYYGALIGRVANRIRGGRFVLDGKSYQLPVDAKGIHLHGGPGGFNTRLWEAETDNGRLRLRYRSPDGEEGYPGSLTATVSYSLQGNDLHIDYEAVTDAPTIVNLTNHQFFNLNGCAGDILDHVVRIRADSYTPVDATLLPTGDIAPVSGTSMDFTAPKAIGRDLAAVPGGYDHNFVLARQTSGEVEWLVDVQDPHSGRTLSVGTTEPCLQFYIGNFLDGSDTGRHGRVYRKHYGFCLEAQKHPDGINHGNFASPVLRPGETYSQHTIYRFGCR